MDPVTLTEAVIVGNPRAGKANLIKVAIAKLEMQLQKNMAKSLIHDGTPATVLEILFSAPSGLNPKVAGIFNLRLWQCRFCKHGRTHCADEAG